MGRKIIVPSAMRQELLHEVHHELTFWCRKKHSSPARKVLLERNECRRR